MITSIPSSLPEASDRARGLGGSDDRRGSTVGSQDAMKNLKVFGRYLFHDENIMYIILMLGRASAASFPVYDTATI